MRWIISLLIIGMLLLACERQYQYDAAQRTPAPPDTTEKK